MISANVTEALRSSPIDVVFSWRDGVAPSRVCRCCFDGTRTGLVGLVL
jgi:hypothetical protein